MGFWDGYGSPTPTKKTSSSSFWNGYKEQKSSPQSAFNSSIRLLNTLSRSAASQPAPTKTQQVASSLLGQLKYAQENPKQAAKNVGKTIGHGIYDPFVYASMIPEFSTRLSSGALKSIKAKSTDEFYKELAKPYYFEKYKQIGAGKPGASQYANLTPIEKRTAAFGAMEAPLVFYTPAKSVAGAKNASGFLPKVFSAAKAGGAANLPYAITQTGKQYGIEDIKSNPKGVLKSLGKNAVINYGVGYGVGGTLGAASYGTSKIISSLPKVKANADLDNNINAYLDSKGLTKNRAMIDSEGAIRMRNSSDYFRELSKLKDKRTIGTEVDNMADQLGRDRLVGSNRSYVVNQIRNASNPKQVKQILEPHFVKNNIQVNTYGQRTGEVAQTAKVKVPMVNSYGKSTPLDDWMYRLGNKTDDQADTVAMKALNKKIFGDDNLNIVENLTTPEGRQALGAYRQGMIQILNKQGNPVDTFHHEAVHKAFDLFTSRDEQISILRHGIKKYGTNDLKKVEENIAEDFIKFVNTKKAPDAGFKGVFENMLHRIKSVFSNEDSITQLYKRLDDGNLSMAETQGHLSAQPAVTSTTGKAPAGQVPGAQTIMDGGQVGTPANGSVLSPNSAQNASSSFDNNIHGTDQSVNGDSVQKIITALKQAKPLQSQQKALYAKARAQQAAKISAMGSKVSGESGYHAQLGQLKGGLPKVEFESIRKQITQPDIDNLFNQVEQAQISPFEKITAKTGLAKLLGAEGGSLPTQSELGLLNEIFPAEFTSAILEKRSLTSKLFSAGAEALNLPRSVMATADLSAPLRQGIFFIGRPKQWIPAFKDMFKYAFSEDAYTDDMARIKLRPTYKAMRESGLALTDVKPMMGTREEAFMSNLAEKIPVFGRVAKGSNRAYSGFLNRLRADVFDDLYKSADNLGVLQARPSAVDDIANFVNTGSGRGNLNEFLQKASPILNGAFFSPRLMASRFNLLNPLYYAKLDPFVRKEALKSLGSFLAIGSTALGIAKLNGAEVGVDPRSSDFGKIKIGNTRYDVWGGFQQYAVLAYRLWSGEMVYSTTGKEIQLGEGYTSNTRWDIIQRFFESKTAPVASFGIGMLKNKKDSPDEFRMGPELIDRMLPMLWQDAYDLYREYGTKGLPMALPGMFGVGSQTYGDKIPKLEKTPTGKPTIKWREETTLGEDILNKITGKQISNIPKDKWGELQKEKNAETIKQADLDRAKKIVLETGQSMVVGNTLVYLKDGIVKTKKLDKTQSQPTTKSLLESLK